MKQLFIHRRWMLWLPVCLSCWAAWPNWQLIPAHFLAGCVFGIPFWLAWWLSDGFKGMSKWPGAGPNQISSGIGPTGKPSVIIHNRNGNIYNDINM